METIRRQLERAVKGAKIDDATALNSKPLKVTKEVFLRAVKGAEIKDVRRRAKLLLLYLSNGTILMFHLKMTGRMLLSDKSRLPTKHTHIIFKLSGAKHNLFFEDYRKFGFVKVFEGQGALEEYFRQQGYGPEPLSEEFSYEPMKQCLLARPKKKIKQVLMEQKCVAGIGNIYASEICFYARLNPFKKIGDMREDEFKKIYTGTKEILRKAIASRGSSSDAYLDAYGRAGQFVPKLKVYGRDGRSCLRCGNIIKKEMIGGRGTYYCPKCQK